jgi:hypothetical protein
VRGSCGSSPVWTPGGVGEARKLRDEVRRRGYLVFGSGETALRAGEDPVDIDSFEADGR